MKRAHTTLRRARTATAAALLFASAAVVASGCASPADGIETVFDPCAPLVLRVEADARQSERAAVGAAAAMWNAAAGAALRLEDGDVASPPAADATTATASDDAPPVVPVRFDPAGANFHGLYDDHKGVVFINDHITSDHARMVTVAHEVGHAFGLLHVSKDERPSLMNDGNMTVELLPDDVAQLRALWGTCTVG